MRVAHAALAGCLAASIVACSGPAAVASSPATAHPSATAATGARSAMTTVVRYYRAIESRNYRTAFTYFAARATGPDGRRLTWRAFSELAGMFDRAEGRVTSFSVLVDPTLTVVTIVRQRIGIYHTHLRLARTGDGWAITAIDRI